MSRAELIEGLVLEAINDSVPPRTTEVVSSVIDAIPLIWVAPMLRSGVTQVVRQVLGKAYDMCVQIDDGGWEWKHYDRISMSEMLRTQRYRARSAGFDVSSSRRHYDLWEEDHHSGLSWIEVMEDEEDE